jgi:D-xylulose reductase
MSDNPSLVLRGIEDVIYEQRPIPESRYSSLGPTRSLCAHYCLVKENDVLVAVKKTGQLI